MIRDFQPGDFETLWRMDQECFEPGIAYSRRELKAYIRHPATFTLVATNGPTAGSAAEPEGEAVKNVQGFIVVHRGVTGHIITIDVSPAARRSRVGSELLQTAEQRLRDAGCSAVSLETAVDNLAALAFYKRYGYNVIRTSPRYYSNGVDALVLNKELG